MSRTVHLHFARTHENGLRYLSHGRIRTFAPNVCTCLLSSPDVVWTAHLRIWLHTHATSSVSAGSTGMSQKRILFIYQGRVPSGQHRTGWKPGGIPISRRIVTGFAPLPQESLVNFSNLSPFVLRVYAFSVFCGEKCTLDAKGMHFAVETTASPPLTFE